MKNEQLNDEAFDALFSARIGREEKEILKEIEQFESQPVSYRERPVVRTTAVYKII
jgi:hypothetical protein